MPTEESLVAAFQKLDEKGQNKDKKNVIVFKSEQFPYFFTSRSGLHQPRRFPPLDDDSGGEVAGKRNRQHAAGGANDNFDFDVSS